MRLLNQQVLFLAALCAEWWIPFGLCMLAERRRERQRNFVAFWRQQFDTQVACQWIHYDGMGH